jgi:hypothetical protein
VAPGTAQGVGSQPDRDCRSIAGGPRQGRMLLIGGQAGENFIHLCASAGMEFQLLGGHVNAEITKRFDMSRLRVEGSLWSGSLLRTECD